MQWTQFALLFVWLSVPLAFTLGRDLMRRRFEARWRQEAARLGLESEGVIPSLRISGMMGGVEVHLLQSATFPSKERAVYWHTARARVPTRVSDERAILASYRTEPRRVEEPIANDVFADLRPVDGWFEHRGSGLLDPNEIEPLLLRLVRTARAETLAQVEREEEEERRRGSSS